MEISTKRLKIRFFEIEDLEDLYQIYQKAETCRYLLHDVWSEDNKEEYFKEKLINTDINKKISLAVEFNHKVIGDLSVMPYSKETLEIGYTINSEYSHQGFAVEAVKALIDYLFETYPVHRIITNMDARNIASKKVCEKIGMRKEAHFIQDYFNKGEWTDSYIYAVLKDEIKA